MTPARLRWKHINSDPDLGGYVILGVIAVILTVFAGHWFNSQLRYLIDGVTANGQVVDKRIVAGYRPAVAAVVAHGGRRGLQFVIRYEFRDAAGQVQTGSEAIDADEWRRLGPGDAIEVEFLRTEPSRNRLGGRGSLWLPLGLTVAGAAGLFGLLTLIRRRLQSINESVRLTFTGRPVLGLVTTVQRHKPPKGEAFLIVNYCYQVGDCWRAELHAGSFRCAVRPSESWAAGEPLLVLIDESDPSHHAPDKFRVRPGDLAILLGVPPESSKLEH